MISNVSGKPTSNARPGSRQAAVMSRMPARMPSVKSTLHNAASATRRTNSWFGVARNEVEHAGTGDETR